MSFGSAANPGFCHPDFTFGRAEAHCGVTASGSKISVLCCSAMVTYLSSVSNCHCPLLGSRSGQVTCASHNLQLGTAPLGQGVLSVTRWICRPKNVRGMGCCGDSIFAVVLRHDSRTPSKMNAKQ